MATNSKKPKLKQKKTFSLKEFKKTKELDNTAFKKQEYLKISDDFTNVVGTSIPIGCVTLLMGHSDTGKTSAMLKAAASSQRMGRLPVFIITEMKWNWEHAINLGLEVEKVVEDIVDENTGEVQKIESYDGQFIYIDKSQLKSIEDVAEFINGLLDQQEKGDLPLDLDFFWDSIGSVPCQMSIDKQKNNNEWNAGAFSREFGGSVNQRITASRKLDSEYTNSLICINKVWVDKPSVPMGQPKIMPKGGTTMYFDAAMVMQFGNVKNSGATKIQATKNNKKVTYASRVNVKIKKNHINGISTDGKIIVTPTDIIEDNPNKIKKYKEEHIEEIAKLLGEINLEQISVDDFVDTYEVEEGVTENNVEPNEEKKNSKN